VSRLFRYVNCVITCISSKICENSNKLLTHRFFPRWSPVFPPKVMIVAHPNKRWVFVRSRQHRAPILADDMADRRITSSATSVLLSDWIPPLGRSSIAFRVRSFRYQPHGRIIPRQGPQHKRIPSSSAVDKWGYAGRCSRLLLVRRHYSASSGTPSPLPALKSIIAPSSSILPGNQTLNVDHHGQLDVPPIQAKDHNSELPANSSQ